MMILRNSTIFYIILIAFCVFNIFLYIRKIKHQIRIENIIEQYNQELDNINKQ